MIARVKVHITASDQNGDPLAGAPINVVLSHTDVDPDDGYVFPEEINVTAGPDGKAMIELWPNELGSTESFYTVKITNPDTGKVQRLVATIPNMECRLHTVANLPPYPGKTDGQLAVDAAVAAIAPAQAAAVAAQESEEDAAGFASSAAGSATSAYNSAQAAAGSATTASTKAADAAGHAANAATSAGQAADSATAANGSKTAAATSATNAATSATTASTKAGEAATSATNAATSATTAGTKAGEAATSATAAAGSATTAGNKATEAAGSATAAATSATNAATSATTAGTKAGEASTSAGNAAASATAAATSATNAGNSAGTASTKAGEAATSATNAATAAGTANTKAGEAATSATNAATSATTATTKAGEAAGSASAAADSAAAANTSKAQAESSAAAAAGSAFTAAGSATAANNGAIAAASNAALALSQAAIVQASREFLASIAQTIHSGAIVDAFLYDTNRDSDGGAWRQRCQNASWYNEPLNGKWLGQYANETAARGDNMLAHTEEFSGSAWTKYALTINSDAAVAPNGTLSADKLVEDSTGTAHRVRVGALSMPNNQVRTFSVYAKAAERSHVTLQMNGFGGNFLDCTFNLAAGTAGNLNSFGNSKAAGASITPVGDGWYLCSLTGLPNINDTTANLDQNIYINNGTTTNYVGTGSSGILLWGAKINKTGEQASTYSASTELVAGGSFEAMPPNISTVNGAVASIVNSALRVTNGDANFGRAEIAIPTVVGKVYALNLSRIGGTGNGTWNLGTNANRNLYATLQTGNTATFIATDTAAIVSLTVGGSVQGAYYDYDSLSLKEVTTYATPYVSVKDLFGSYYQSTTDGKFYMLNSPYGQLETFRGNTREFPALAGIVAETTRITIYDLATGAMWKSEISKQTTGTFGEEWWRTSKPITSLHALNGVLYFGLNPGSSDASCGLAFINFPADTVGRYSTSTTSGGRLSYGARNVGTLDDSLPVIPNAAVNDVAAAVLPGAPVDAATGLPVATIAIAHAGGLSVIKDSGTIVTGATATEFRKAVFTARNDLLSAVNGSQLYIARDAGQLAAAFPLTQHYGGSSSYVPAGANIHTGITALTPMAGAMLAKANTSQGVTLVRENPASPLKGMAAFIYAAYNTGWMVGDIRGAWLADTAAETISHNNVVANGDFTTDLTGWTLTGAAVITDGKLSLTRGAGAGASAVRAITCEVGKSYTITAEVSGPNLGRIDIANTVNLGGTIFQKYGIVNGTYMASFVATATTHYIGLLNSTGADGANVLFDNVSVRENLIVNGTFDNDLSGWITGTNGGTSTVAWVDGKAVLTGDGTNQVRLDQSFATVPGRAYVITCTTSDNVGNLTVGTGGFGNTSYFVHSFLPVGQTTITFVATTDKAYMRWSRTITGSYSIDNVLARPAEADRSVKAKPLTINGSLTKAPVAAGGQLVSMAGFTTANYLEQEYNADLDFGTGDFSVFMWVKVATNVGGQSFVGRRTPNYSGAGFSLQTGNGGILACTIFSSVDLISTTAINDGLWHLIGMYRTGGNLILSLDGKDIASVANAASVSNPTAVLRIGANLQLTGSAAGTNMALLRISATAPTADQIAQMYRDELPLFQPNAKCTLDGGNAGVTALAYDDSTDVLHVGTSWGRSEIKGLARIASSATVSGAITALAAGMGAHMTAGASLARYVQPAITLRDELRRRWEARRAIALEPIPLDFDGAAAQTAFPLPAGYSAKFVRVAGVEKRPGATKDFSVSFDGYRETVNFGVSPGEAWVRITANRSN